MKWIRRKPSLRVYKWTVSICVVVLICVGLWITRPVEYRISDAGFLIHGWITGDNRYPWHQEQPSCYIVAEDGRFRVLGDGSRPSDALWAQHQTQVYRFNLDYARYGFFAPTRVRIRQWIRQSPFRVEAFPERLQACSDLLGLGLTPDDDGFLSIDPSLNDHNDLAESRVLLSGHAINLCALAAITGLVWAARWTPYQVRAQIRKRRRARGLCPLCRYDLIATPGQCPECGWGHEGEGNGGPADGVLAFCMCWKRFEGGRGA